jgi:hypothetical protein
LMDRSEGTFADNSFDWAAMALAGFIEHLKDLV